MNREAVIEQPKQTRETLDKLLALLQSSEADRFVAHIYASRREFPSIRNGQARGTRRSSEPSFPTSQSRKAWDSKASFASGSTCCGDRPE